MDTRDAQSKAASVLSGRFRRPLLLIIALIVLIAGYFAVLADPIRIYQQNFDILGKLNSDISLAKTDLATSKMFSDKLYRLSPLESRLLKMALPDRPDDSSIVEQLTSIVHKSGFYAGNIDIEEANKVAGSKTNSEKIGKISIRLKLNGGGYDELKQLLRLLESSLMMFDVYSVNFTAKSPSYDLALVTYYFNNSVALK